MLNKKLDRIYIAGPMRGYINYNYYKFFEVERELIKKGYDVVNPAYEALKLAHEQNVSFDKIDHDTYINNGMELLKKCSAVYFLNNWEDSKGSCLKYEYAVAHKYQLFFENWDNLKNF